MSIFSDAFDTVKSTLNPSTLLGNLFGGGVGGMTGSQALGNLLSGKSPTDNLMGGLSLDALGLSAAPFAAAGTAALGGSLGGTALPAESVIGAGEFPTDAYYLDAADAGNIAGLEGTYGMGLGDAAAAGTSGFGGLGNIGGGLSMAGVGGGLAALLGYYGAQKQREAQQQIAAENRAMGAPYRRGLADLYSPGGVERYLASPEVQIPINEGTNALMRALSVQTGNPYGSPNALMQGQRYATDAFAQKIGQERDRRAGFGGLTSYTGNSYAPQQAAIQSQGNMYNALGSGVATIFNPPQTLAQQFAAYNREMRNAQLS